MSKTPLEYLRRKRVFDPLTRHKPVWATRAQKSHSRPIVHHPDLTGADGVRNRTLTQVESRRVPYRRVPEPR